MYKQPIRAQKTITLADSSLLLFRCCEDWKGGYQDITEALKHQNTTQLPDGAGIFTQIDAFMQRCRDLQDIADCQAQFARWLDGEKAPVPNIGDGESPLRVSPAL